MQLSGRMTLRKSDMSGKSVNRQRRIGGQLAGCQTGRIVVEEQKVLLFFAFKQLQRAGAQTIDGTRLANLTMVFIRYVGPIDTHAVDVLPCTAKNGR